MFEECELNCALNTLEELCYLKKYCAKSSNRGKYPSLHYVQIFFKNIYVLFKAKYTHMRTGSMREMVLGQDRRI